MEDLDEIVHEFLVESHENLDQLDSDLVALEVSPGSRDLLGSVFRTIHTIKGTSGFLAFGALEKLTHAGESLLVDLRDGRRAMDEPTTSVLLRMVDAIRAILGAIEADGTEGDVDVAPLVEQIRAVLAASPEPEPEPTPVVTLADDDTKASAGKPAARSDAGGGDAEPVSPTPVPAAKRRITAAAKRRPAVVAGRAAAAVEVRAETTATIEPSATETAEPDVTETAGPGALLPTQRSHIDRVAPPQGAAPEVGAAEEVTPEPPVSDGAPTRSAADASVRVDVELLDVLMRQVGELVLARNAITRLADDAAGVDLVRASQRLSLIASELQEGVMKTRMQPIEHVWSKVPRMVRDLAAACDRQVRLEMTGGDTELDRSLLEAIKDPLTHLVRNAIDHGIESPADRVAAGKAPQGVLSLRAYHAGGQVIVEISDDGRGVDPARIAAKAVESGLRTAQQVAAMAPADLLQLLFLPGFSTAETVTNVSGRGVGMDVVRTKIEAIGGLVDVESTIGKGTAWRLRIPLTLAIMPALTVECDGELYAIPQVSLLELVALDSQTNGSAIEYVRTAPVYRLRGDLLPLVDLREVFGSVPRGEGDRTTIAVLQSDTQRFGLLVDRVLNTEEIVVKPLPLRLKTIGMYAGATLLGDGRVALILDVQAIARRSMAADLGEADVSATARATATDRTIVQMLVVGVGDGGRVAIPLSDVTRLEKLPMAALEHVGGQQVVQYRGAITPLVQLSRTFGRQDDPDAELTVVVCTRRGRSVAIVVDEIIDIVVDDEAQHSDVGDHGLLGSTVLKNRVTELLDVRSAVEAADPLFYADGTEGADDGSGSAELDELAGLAELVGV